MMNCIVNLVQSPEAKQMNLKQKEECFALFLTMRVVYSPHKRIAEC